jgi:hypothetical protein
MATSRFTSIPMMIAVCATIVGVVGYFGLYRPLHEEKVRDDANRRHDELTADFHRLKTEMASAQKACLKEVDGRIARALPKGLSGATGSPPTTALAHAKVAFAQVPYVGVLTTPPPAIDGGRVCTPRWSPPLGPDITWPDADLDVEGRRAAIADTRQGLQTLKPPPQFAATHGRCLSNRHCYGTTAWISGDGQLDGILNVDLLLPSAALSDDGYRRLLGTAADAALAKL